MLIDVKECDANKVEKLFQDAQLIFKQEYTSSNGNSMIMYYYNISY